MPAVAATGAIQIVSADAIGRKNESSLELLTNSGLVGTKCEGTLEVLNNALIAPGEVIGCNMFSSVTEGVDWAIGADEAETAQNIADAFLLMGAGGTIDVVGAVLTVTSVAAEANSNVDFTFGVSGLGFDADNTVQGVAPLQIGLISGYIAGPGFTPGATLADTLEAIKTAMEADPVDGAAYDFTLASPILTATAKVAGHNAAGGGTSFTIQSGDGTFASAAQGQTPTGDTRAFIEVTVNDYAAVAAVGAFAMGTVEVIDWTGLAGKVLTIDLTVLGQGVINLTEGSEWTAATDNETTAASISAALAPYNGFVYATVVGPVVTIKGFAKSVLGNSIGISTDDPTNLNLSGATLSGGVAGVLLNVISSQKILEGLADGTATTGGDAWGVDGLWSAVTSNNQTAQNIADIINAVINDPSAARVNNVVAVTIATYGSSGNGNVSSLDNETGASIETTGLYAGGTDAGLEIEVGDETYVAFEDFTFPNDATEEDIADALATAISNALPTGLDTAIDTGDTVDLTADPGEAGNSIALATSKVGGATVSGAFLTGGEDDTGGGKGFFGLMG